MFFNLGFGQEASTKSEIHALTTNVFVERCYCLAKLSKDWTDVPLPSKQLDNLPGLSTHVGHLGPLQEQHLEHPMQSGQLDVQWDDLLGHVETNCQIELSTALLRWRPESCEIYELILHQKHTVAHQRIINNLRHRLWVPPFGIMEAAVIPWKSAWLVWASSEAQVLRPLET